MFLLLIKIIPSLGKQFLPQDYLRLATFLFLFGAAFLTVFLAALRLVVLRLVVLRFFATFLVDFFAVLRFFAGIKV